MFPARFREKSRYTKGYLQQFSISRKRKTKETSRKTKENSKKLEKSRLKNFGRTKTDSRI